MPSGRYLSKQDKELIIRLHKQGLSGPVIAIRTGYSKYTVRILLREWKRGGK